jgi:hypothetical protein
VASVPERRRDARRSGGTYDAALGHWDVERFPGENRNLLPIETLAKLTKRVLTGHVHAPEFEARRAGDGDGSLSRSLMARIRGSALSNDAARRRGREWADRSTPSRTCACASMPGRMTRIHQIDCLQLRVRRAEVPDDDDEQVGFLDFDIGRIFDESMTEAGLRARCCQDQGEARPAEVVMIRRLHLQSCFVHEDVELVFERGLTAITGRNRTGKS